MLGKGVQREVNMGGGIRVNLLGYDRYVYRSGGGGLDSNGLCDIIIGKLVYLGL